MRSVLSPSTPLIRKLTMMPESAATAACYASSAKPWKGTKHSNEVHMGQGLACTRALQSVSVPSCAGVACRDRPMNR